MPDPAPGAAVIEAGHSHLYPGATCRIAGLRDAPVPCLVVFADGASALGRITPAQAGLRLDVGAYRTVRGREIGAKAWHLVPLPDGRLRVEARLDAAPLSRPGAPPTRHP